MRINKRKLERHNFLRKSTKGRSREEKNSQMIGAE